MLLQGRVRLETVTAWRMWSVLGGVIFIDLCHLSPIEARLRFAMFVERRRSLLDDLNRPGMIILILFNAS